MVEQRLERTYRVRFDEAGPDGMLRSSGFLRYAQDLAWIHSESAGFGREWYAERGLTWLVRGIELDLLTDVAYGSELVVSTQVIGYRRIWLRRRTEFHLPGSERPCGLALTDWVLLNAKGMPTRVPSDVVVALGDVPTEFNPIRLEIPVAPVDAVSLELSVRRSELDPMEHVNNAAYLDYLDETWFVGEGARGSMPTPRRYRAEFIASAAPNAELLGQLWPDGERLSYRLEDESGQELLRAHLETDLASWVGG